MKANANRKRTERTETHRKVNEKEMASGGMAPEKQKAKQTNKNKEHTEINVFVIFN